MFLWEYYKRSLLCDLLMCIPSFALTAGGGAGYLPENGSTTDTVGLKRLYDLVLQNMDTPSERLYLDSLETLSVSEENPEYQGLVYRNRVRYYYNKTHFDSAVYFANQAIPFFRKNNQRENLTDVESMIVNLHTWRNEYEFALVKGNEMYDESRRMGDKKGMIVACENIGFALANSYRGEDALEWYRKSLALLRGLKDEEICEVRMELLMVDCFMALNEVDSMKGHLEIMKRALSDFEANRGLYQEGKVRVIEYWVWLYSQLAEASVREKSYKKAKVYLTEAGRYVSRGVEPMSMEVFYWACSNYYQALGDYDRALEAERNASRYSLAYKDDTPEQLFRFSRIYTGRGDMSHAVSLYKEGLALSDSIRDSIFSSQISQFNSIYAVKELTEEVEHQRVAVDQLRLVLLSLSAFALLLCVFVFIIHRYKKRLSEATLRAKEADVRTTVFLDNVSREIRLALDDISGLSHDLIKAQEGKEKRHYSEQVRGKNETLQRVIFNILDVSKIQSDRMAFDYVNIYLPEMMNRIKEWVARLLPPGRSFKLVMASELYLKSDISRLRQVLENLLCFFLTHGDRGDIVMEYHPEGIYMEFNVSCAELNLSAEERGLLFDRQAQAGKCLEDMGLELVICKDLITKMGGALFISDKKEEGTSFTFTLPIGTT